MRRLLESIVSDLDLDPDELALFQGPGEGSGGKRSFCLAVDSSCFSGEEGPSTAGANLKALCSPRLAKGGLALVYRECVPKTSDLAAFRNTLWPEYHVPAVYVFRKNGPSERLDLNGRHKLDKAPSSCFQGSVFMAVPRETALSPNAVMEKFDRNASGWNGTPGSPTYSHFRWMRRIMAEAALPVAGKTVLDAGCGAGWVGTEAALLGASVSAFDPSPEMVRYAGQNAKEHGVEMDCRVGFGEEPPFESPFDAVISSGVVSFSPDHDRFMDGLDSMLKRGGTLVVGDLNRCSLGMRLRRSINPVLPLRELNSLSRASVIQMLARRGYRIEKSWYYQLTLPVPQLMHISETRMGGLGCTLLLLLNRFARALDHAAGSFAGRLFDSYIVRARKTGSTVA